MQVINNSVSINQFIASYDEDITFRKSVEEKYDKSPYELTIMELYALEEMKNYGKKGYYKAYLDLKDEDTSLEDHLGFYDFFRKRMTTNLEFAITKYNNIEHLSQKELFIVGMILYSVAIRENIEIYDPLNRKLTDTDEHFFQTIRNHQINILATALYDKAPELFECRVKGQFSNESKKEIINMIRQIPYYKVKIDFFIYILKNTPTLLYYPDLNRNWDKYNTNISYDDVYGNPKKPIFTK